MAKGNKTILALYGAANTGKTATLRKLIELLESKADKKANDLGETRWLDRLVIVYYKNKTIGIFTGGDSRKDLEFAMEKLGENCDLYVCASRTSGQTTEHLKEQAKTVYWVRRTDVSATPEGTKPTDALRAIANEHQANDLLEMIEKILF